jgi:oligo-1,6-glucosidase
MKKQWWKETIVYQIYPRSFQDSNADGIGDIPGIISRLDYLQDLGVEVLWLSPFFSSPNADNGYDISDYEGIMPDFGTMQDFDNLLEAVHTRGLKLLIDLVVNHSSDEHRWFQESRKSNSNPYRDYYIWKAPAADGGPPNDWVSFFSGPAWTLDPTTGEYYLHLFAKKQPDLNWENPKLRQEIYSMMRFWLDKGVDGFRMDVISLLSKDPQFANYPVGQEDKLGYYANGPRVHEYLREMYDEVLSKYDCMTVGEGFGVSVNEVLDYVGDSRNELQSIYHFDHAVPREEACFLAPKPEFTLPELRAIFTRWDQALGTTGWQGIYWGNHDNPRIVSRIGHPDFHIESAKAIALMLLTMRGTPYIYQGDEIGMSNCPFESVVAFDDVQVRNAYAALVQDQGGDEAAFLAACNRIARDHARTPMQWSDEALAGFTQGERTWLNVNPNYLKINVKDQVNDPGSIFNFYKKLIEFRKSHPVFVSGEQQFLQHDQPEKVWALLRYDAQESWLVLVNVSAESLRVTVSEERLSGGCQWYLGNGLVPSQRAPGSWALAPFEGHIFKL